MKRYIRLKAQKISYFLDEYTIQSNNAIFNPPYTHIILRLFHFNNHNNPSPNRSKFTSHLTSISPQFTHNLGHRHEATSRSRPRSGRR